MLQFYLEKRLYQQTSAKWACPFLIIHYKLTGSTAFFLSWQNCSTAGKLYLSYLALYYNIFLFLLPQFCLSILGKYVLQDNMSLNNHRNLLCGATKDLLVHCFIAIERRRQLKILKRHCVSITSLGHGRLKYLKNWNKK